MTSRTGGKKKNFDDQAWEIESDDDDFVSQIAPRTNVPRSLKSSSRTSSYSSTHQAMGSSNTATHATSSSSASVSRPVISTSLSTRQHTDSPSPIDAPGRTRDRRTSWTVVDRDVPARSASLSQSQAPIAGSPPADLGGEEFLREAGGSGSGSASGSGFQFVAPEDAAAGKVAADGQQTWRQQQQQSLTIQSDESAHGSGSETDEFDLETGKTVRRKRSTSRKARPGRREAQSLAKSIRPDLDALVTDPANALAKLSLSWCSADVAEPSTPISESGRDSSAESRERTDASGMVPTPTNSGFTFDPIAAAGDGLIITGPSFVDAAADERGSNAKSISSASSSSYTAGRASSTSRNGHAGSDASSSGKANRSAHQRGASGSGSGSGLLRKRSVRTARRRQQLLTCLSKQSIDIGQLRTLAWAGIPNELRPVVWQLLLGYLPAVASVRPSTLARKRAEYAAGVKLAFAKGTAALDQAIWHQIHIDVPRTNPGIRLWQREATQKALERILYVWAIRHPASGYVQGINDLATPFFEVFLSAYIDSDPEMFDVALLPPGVLEAIEADTFWCLSKLLDGIQDNYIFAQPGIQRQVRRMGELVARIDAPLHAHLQEQGVEYMQFAFRWMNCLLMREMSVRNIIRMWDTYLAEGPDAFSDFHLYVCSVFLHKWTEKLQTMDFQGIIMFLQSLPTQGWSDKDAEMLLSEAFMYKTLFGNSAHLHN
ncbi:RabGAP/TBC [Testicularia cyperi]|uniref:RabGAP/TBC n=1 Tax=Testicularia cyperi TaxID=1882483 RepID=A0A317XU93_9BASI|nr:RabGAP/TBC [Testicularia cyperi]